MKIRNTIAANVANIYCDFENNKYNLPKGRKRFRSICSLGRSPKIAYVSDHTICGKNVRYYKNSLPGHPRHTLLYFHGGGFVLGSIKSHDILARRIAKYCDINVLSIEYSLAPEHKFPTQIKESANIIDSILKSRPSFIDDGKLLIGGDSAGGTIAASLATQYSHHLAGLFLLYPMLDLSKEHPSVIKNGVKKNFLTADMIRYFINQYVPNVSKRKQPSVSPLFAPRDTLLPSFIATGSLDPFIDESKLYAQRLKDANIPHRFISPPSTIHGFMQFPRAYGYAKVLREFKELLRASL